MAVRRVVLSNRSSAAIGFSELAAVAQALQTQVDRDFAPVWGVRAQITALNPGDPVPAGAWPMTIVDKPVGGLGIHLDKNHRPYAQVKATADWSITASHELLEMLVDPYGHKFTQGPDIDPHSDHHNVSYLVEVADPCEVYAYGIDGVRVSDFVTQEYYNAHAPAGTELDFLRRLKKAYAVPAGCYISWTDPADGRWHQKRPDGSFVRAKVKVHPKRNPREERDKAFGEERERHDLAAILARHAAAAA